MMEIRAFSSMALHRPLRPCTPTSRFGNRRCDRFAIISQIIIATFGKYFFPCPRRSGGGRGGRCVILISHPCFAVPGASSWLAEGELSHATKVSRRVHRYRGTFDTWERWSFDSTLELHRYHLPLSWYFGAIRVAGMAVAMLEEPRPTAALIEQQPESSTIDEFPMHIVIEARPCPAEWCVPPKATEHAV